MLAEAPFDCWLIGDPAAPCPAQLQSRASVRRSWFENQLDVELVQRLRSTGVALPLPAPEDSVRLLRRPFDQRVAAADGITSKAHSLKRPPLFSSMREWLAVEMIDGSVNVYRIPDRPQAKPGRPRNLSRPAHADCHRRGGPQQEIVRHGRPGRRPAALFRFPGAWLQQVDGAPS
jgi:hypothetical protein